MAEVNLSTKEFDFENNSISKRRVSQINPDNARIYYSQLR